MDTLCDGTRVVLCGLVRRPELNGKRGVVVCDTVGGKSGRCNVRLDHHCKDSPVDTEKTICINTRHLKKVIYHLIKSTPI